MTAASKFVVTYFAIKLLFLMKLAIQRTVFPMNRFTTPVLAQTDL